MHGIDGEIVTVEVDIAPGIPSFALLGLPDSALSESRERVRSALTHSGFLWPQARITVSLSPAWLPKTGSGFDLSIAIAILVADGRLDGGLTEGLLLLGELSLDGRIRPARGIVPALLIAQRKGIRRAIVPEGDRHAARLIEEVESFGVSTLRQAISVISGNIQEEIYVASEIEAMSHPTPLDPQHDFADVAGQEEAIEFLTAAA
ncbi:MAG: magnesium chelatase domain-containing protein, partial [Candidatus Nanopelagicaceae bacterium]